MKRNVNKIILDSLRRDLHIAEVRWIEAACQRAGSEAAKKAWDEFNPDDGVGGISGCPHHPERAREIELKARARHDELKEALKHATDTFVEGTDA